MSSDLKLRNQSLRAISFGTVIASGTWIYAFYCRITHAGRVCSGDFLYGANDDHYLMMQGLFLKWAIIIIMSLAFVGILFSVIYMSIGGIRVS